ncbi:MAG: tetratricopeptide repeat protein [Acidobacteria bacterium]|nr:tetratricopeptide repeat protein [Acidobacteriota bacterium]
MVRVLASGAAPSEADALLAREIEVKVQPLLERAIQQARGSKETSELRRLIAFRERVEGLKWSGRGDYLRAAKHLARAESLARELGLSRLREGSLHNLTYVYFQLNEPQEAWAAARRALQVSKELREISLYNLGWLALKAGRCQESISWFQKAAEAAREKWKASAMGVEVEHRFQGPAIREAISWLTLASAHFCLGRLEDAFTVTHRALELARQLRNPRYEVWSLYNLGSLFHGLGDSTGAAAVLFVAREKARRAHLSWEPDQIAFLEKVLESSDPQEASREPIAPAQRRAPFGAHPRITLATGLGLPQSPIRISIYLTGSKGACESIDLEVAFPKRYLTFRDAHPGSDAPGASIQVQELAPTGPERGAVALHLRATGPGTLTDGELAILSFQPTEAAAGEFYLSPRVGLASGAAGQAPPMVAGGLVKILRRTSP